MQTEVQAQHTDLLTNFDANIVRASTGKRFANYIIDLVVFYILAAVFGVIIAIVSPTLMDNWDNAPNFALLDRLFSMLAYGVYMFIVEAVFKGKSLGKLTTGTRAVNLDGSRMSTSTALGRGFSRVVPFDQLSALGSPSNPWHDKWTNTLVMDEKLSTFVND